MSSSDQRLLLAKYLYLHGSDMLRTAGSFDAGLAVSLFQDAVEMVVLSCAATVDASPKDKGGFAAIWAATDKALVAANKPPLPMWVQMDSLNKARVNFKHAGHVPPLDLAQSCRIDAGDFLTRVTAQYFQGLDFASLSLVSFVVEGEERRLLQAALDLLQKEEVHGAMEKCSQALNHMGERRSKFHSHGIRVALPNIDPKVAAHIKEEIAHLRAQVRDVEAIVFAEACGVSATDYLVVRSILPAAQRSDPRSTMGITVHAARRCTELLAQYSIGLTRQLEAPERVLDEWSWSWLPEHRK